uniref:ATP synthase F0 subunit 8 n=1 Tax=Melinna cristata TaxID=222004 RepID=A0A8A4VPU7_9ANNE|nr:ATP synthase F0 subunit 8 [Melinna cristata]QTD82968.1 ATP synthase F0 subunit 8 [Melinna cristata]
MPHLSPMVWFISPLLFLLLLTPLIMSFLWWSQNPNFPLITSSSDLSKPNNWNWA